MINAKLSLGVIATVAIVGGFFVTGNINQGFSTEPVFGIAATHRSGKVLAASANAPSGVLDVANCDVIGGWAYDPDTSWSQIAIHIYKDGPAGSGIFLTNSETISERPDVNGYFGITGNHGFTISTPSSLKDGINHSIYVYAIDSSGGTSTHLINSPMNVYCPTATPPPPPPAPTGSPTLSVSASTATVGGVVTVSWANLSAPQNTYWVGFYPMGVNDYGFFGEFYLGSCSTTLGNAPATSGSCQFTIPSVATGTYKFNLFEDVPPANGLATSANFSIGTPTAPTPTPAPAPTPPPVLPPPPAPANRVPVGVLDTANCDIIGGWAYDPDSATSQIDVAIYVSGNIIPWITASTSSLRADVNNYLGTSGNHGFTVSTPAILKDGLSRSVTVYAKDSLTGTNYQLTNSPKTINCPVTTTPPPPPSTTANVSLAADQSTAGNQTVTAWTSNIPLLKFWIQNTGSAAVQVTSMDVTLDGTAISTDVSQVYWYDYQLNTLLGKSAFGSNKHATISLGSGGVTVLAGSSKTILIMADVPTTARNGATFRFLGTVSGPNIVISGGPVGSVVGSGIVTISNPDAAQPSTPLSITNLSLPNAKVGQNYFQLLTASGGVGPYGWEGINLPPGLFVSNQQTDNNSNIGGVPTQAGTYTFSIRLSAKADEITKQFTMVVESGAIAFDGPRPLPTPGTVNTKPIGWIDDVRDGVIMGWALDPNHSDLPIDIHAYFDGGARTGAVPATAITDGLREDVNKVLNASGAHGFAIVIPSQYRDGKTHTVYVYGIDRNDLNGGSNALLSGSGKTFKFTSAVAEAVPGPQAQLNATGRHVRGSVVINDGTVYFLGTNLRYPFPSAEVFSSWGHRFADIVPANSADMALTPGPIVDFPE